MRMGGVRHIVHKELYQWYHEQEGEKPKREIFINRVLRLNYPREEALKIEARIKKKKTEYDENGRVCPKCGIYKERKEYARCKRGFHGRVATCNECRNESKRAYRERNNYQKDKEYKEKKRKLKIGSQIYFNDEIREVMEYKRRKGTKVKSLLSGVERRIDTNCNHAKYPTHCPLFRIIENKITLQEKTDLYDNEMEGMI